jgi:nickel-dependent lactate racemase
MGEIEVRCAAWYGDTMLTLRFPSEWEIIVFAPRPLPALTLRSVHQRITDPIGSGRLSTIAAGRIRAAIIVDDITRPTPVADLLPPVLQELAAGGIASDRVSIVLAVGAHKPASPEHVTKKLGAFAAHVRVLPHDCLGDLVDLGKSPGGTPIHVNRWVMECDLKIGLGGVYPHSDAGFSGGAKIVVPGICGIATARALHQNLPGAGARGGPLTSGFRRDVDEIAARIGLDFVVNAVMNCDRQVAAVFAGDRVAAFHTAVEFAAAHYTIDDEGLATEADVVIADTYPFDTSLLFACGKGIWPLTGKGASSHVVLAACPQGLGHHELSPLAMPAWRRVFRRMRSLRPRQLPRLARKLRGLRGTLRRRQMALLVLSSGLGTDEVTRIYPKGRAFDSWDPLLAALQARHRGARTRVALYRCAPLLIRRSARGSNALRDPGRERSSPEILAGRTERR